ncbi:Fc.00g106050.m01.CDS01 [Cosmosporella sp. VM-42]
MAPKRLNIPGFTPLSDQVFLRESPLPTELAPNDHPESVLIFGWGDGAPKHVLKYADGYQKLYPHATQTIVLSPILKAISSSLNDRSTSMRPLLDRIFPSPDSRENRRILVHCMSNAGGINTAAALHEYRQQFGEPLPHQLLVLDSTPGNPHLTLETLERWSRAMALGVGAYLPLPKIITQGICAIFLAGHRLFENLIGREAASVFSAGAINNEEFHSKNSRKLYLYSKEDEIIGWKDIEDHAAEAKEKGYRTDGVLFDGSGHVGHARLFPERYWTSIQGAWKQAIEESKQA